MNQLEYLRAEGGNVSSRAIRSEGDLEIGSVGLEVVESLSNVLLKLGRVLPRRAVGGDLVEGAHLDC
ncbi:unnamed protein product [Clonostachys solani]|uniref:Uncharacterized protein n=1 Tax=Clonostachys solani TaxID=160281 RepID=A0A9P0EKF9_9HYPO|nr:unnamed protein product [Clonostachys solani]